MRSIIDGEYWWRLTIIGVVVLCHLSAVMSEPKNIPQGAGEHVHNSHDLESERAPDPEMEPDVVTILIETVPTNQTAKNNTRDVPEIEFTKLKAASKSAGLSDAKADRVVRAARALGLQYHEVADLRKVMSNPATSADYAERVRRAMEEAVVDKLHKENGSDDAKSTRASGGVDMSKMTQMKEDSSSQTYNRRSVDDSTSPLANKLGGVGGVAPVAQNVGASPSLFGLNHQSPSGSHVFFATPTTSQSLPEDLDNLWVFSTPTLGRKEAFELVQLSYLLKITRAEVFDLQHEFASGRMTKLRAELLIAELKSRLNNESKTSKITKTTPIDPSGKSEKINKSGATSSEPKVDQKAINKIKSAASLSGVDEPAAERLVRALMDSGLNSQQIHHVGDTISGYGATSHDLHRFIDHLEESSVYKRSLEEDEEQFVATPDKAQGADWIYQR